jgi:hypothetical protein
MVRRTSARIASQAEQAKREKEAKDAIEKAKDAIKKARAKKIKKANDDAIVKLEKCGNVVVDNGNMAYGMHRARSLLWNLMLGLSLTSVFPGDQCTGVAACGGRFLNILKGLPLQTPDDLENTAAPIPVMMHKAATIARKSAGFAETVALNTALRSQHAWTALSSDDRRILTSLLVREQDAKNEDGVIPYNFEENDKPLRADAALSREGEDFVMESFRRMIQPNGRLVVVTPESVEFHMSSIVDDASAVSTVFLLRTHPRAVPNVNTEKGQFRLIVPKRARHGGGWRRTQMLQRSMTTRTGAKRMHSFERWDPKAQKDRRPRYVDEPISHESLPESREQLARRLLAAGPH